MISRRIGLGQVLVQLVGQEFYNEVTVGDIDPVVRDERHFAFRSERHAVLVLRSILSNGLERFVWIVEPFTWYLMSVMRSHVSNFNTNGLALEINLHPGLKIGLVWVQIPFEPGRVETTRELMQDDDVLRVRLPFLVSAPFQVKLGQPDSRD